MKIVTIILEMAHTLDLSRCYLKAVFDRKFQPKIQLSLGKLGIDTGQYEKLKKYALALQEATGFNPRYQTGKYTDYTTQQYYKCSRDMRHCSEALTTVQF